jgi:PIN domain nuclease of toxin-antitoxin system
MAGLPGHHQDPFDRMLIAQAMEEGLTVITHDKKFEYYPIPVLWT